MGNPHLEAESLPPSKVRAQVFEAFTDSNDSARIDDGPNQLTPFIH
jgi:hypothetical protein